MRVLIADRLSPLVSARLAEAGARVAQRPGLAGDALTARLAEADPEVLVVRGTRVTAADVAAAPSLSLVVRAGAGVNTIDLAAASARGVYVANCPGKNAAAVAELTLGHLVSLDRRLVDNAVALREGRWDKKGFSAARGLRGRTLAVLGCGSIGREVIARARAFGMRVVAWSRSLDEATAGALGVARAASPEEAARGADALTVHLPLAGDTRGLVGDAVLGALNPGALLVNTARAEVVDGDALLRAIRERGLRVGLDVFAREPTGGEGSFDDPIVAEAGVYGTHHIGASTAEAEEAVGEEVVRIVVAYRRGEAIPNCVNLAESSPATHMLVVRHADRVGVLAGVLDVLRQAGLNVQEMQNIVFSGAEAACARIALVGEPGAEVLARIRSDERVFAAAASPVG
ncbi:NAD(P)-binding domain-containing protein [Myxococcota bacterium]|nr:NAD(P)-binding domain-containing protein [Myxococcota bacterium]